ncbi:MAG: hypothetical protein ACR2F6_06915 [Mycobacteriales bacterium]
MTFRIATVCSGNICRSPAAAAVLRAKLADIEKAADGVVGHVPALVGPAP